MTTRPILTLASGLLLAASSVAMAAPPAHPAPAAKSTNTATAPTAPKLHAALRSLWQDHVTRTREYALAVKAGDARRSAAAEQAVVANAKQLANAVGGFYGAAAGERQLALLAGHWTAVKDLTRARHASDTAARTRAQQALTHNAGEIADFLSKANPYLPRDTVNALLLAHGGHHIEQVDRIMRGDMKGEQATTAAMRTHMNTIADAMADALARQFPKKAA